MYGFEAFSPYSPSPPMIDYSQSFEYHIHQPTYTNSISPCASHISPYANSISSPIPPKPPDLFPPTTFSSSPLVTDFHNNYPSAYNSPNPDPTTNFNYYPCQQSPISPAATYPFNKYTPNLQGSVSDIQNQNSRYDAEFQKMSVNSRIFKEELLDCKNKLLAEIKDFAKSRSIFSPQSSSPPNETHDQPSHFLKLSVGFAWYPITAEIVCGVFDHYGVVQILHMRHVGDGIEATLHYRSIHSAIAARNALQGLNIHFSGGRMNIQFAEESRPAMEQTNVSSQERFEETMKKLETLCKSLTTAPDRVRCDESVAPPIPVDSFPESPTQFQGIYPVEPIVENISCIPEIKAVNCDISDLNYETENIVCDNTSLFNELEESDFVEIEGDKVCAHDMFDVLSGRIVFDDYKEDQFVANIDEHLTGHKCSSDDTPHFNSEVGISFSLVHLDGKLVQRSSPNMLKFEANTAQVEMISEHKDEALHADELFDELSKGETYHIVTDKVLYDNYGNDSPATLTPLDEHNIEVVGSEILSLPLEIQSRQTHLAQSQEEIEWFKSASKSKFVKLSKECLRTSKLYDSLRIAPTQQNVEIGDTELYIQGQAQDFVAKLLEISEGVQLSEDKKFSASFKQLDTWLNYKESQLSFFVTLLNDSDTWWKKWWDPGISHKILECLKINSYNYVVNVYIKSSTGENSTCEFIFEIQLPMLVADFGELISKSSCAWNMIEFGSLNNKNKSNFQPNSIIIRGLEHYLGIQQGTAIQPSSDPHRLEELYWPAAIESFDGTLRAQQWDPGIPLRPQEYLCFHVSCEVVDLFHSRLPNVVTNKQRVAPHNELTKQYANIMIGKGVLDPIQERTSWLDSSLGMLLSYGWDAIFIVDIAGDYHPRTRRTKQAAFWIFTYLGTSMLLGVGSVMVLEDKDLKEKVLS